MSDTARADWTPKGTMKYLFTGGKGGVGKTAIAAAMAYDLALNHSKRTLLASLNPVHSLSSIFNQDLAGGAVRDIQGVRNLHALEVEIDDAVEEYKKSISKRLQDFFKWAEIPIESGPFIDIATTNPAFHEAAVFDKVMDIVTKMGKDYDAVVFDTAAVANAVRLIGLSKIYGLWLSRMIHSRKEALESRLQMSFRKEKVLEEIKNDPMIADLLRLHEKFNKTKEVLTNPEETAFYFVTIPQSLPISVVRRFIDMVKGFDIPIGGVVVNMVLPNEAARGDETGYLKSKLEEQRGYLKVIEDDLGAYVRGYVPWYAQEVVGLKTLQRVVADLRAFRPET
jgi:arsenite/tail-anchored protein-transporting ATPase